jgi:hypothetical protein
LEWGITVNLIRGNERHTVAVAASTGSGRKKVK